MPDSKTVAGYRIDLRVGVDEAEDGVTERRLAEGTRECDVLIVRQRLVTEEHDLPLQQGRLDLINNGRIERPAQVHAVDLGADVARCRIDADVPRRGGKVDGRLGAQGVDR